MAQVPVLRLLSVGLLALSFCYFIEPTLGSFQIMSWKLQGFYLTSTDNGGYLVSPAAGPDQPNQVFDLVSMSETGKDVVNIITGSSATCSSMCLGVLTYLGYIPAVTQVDCNPGKLSQYWLRTAAPTEPSPSTYNWYKNLGGTDGCMTSETWTTPYYVDIYACTDGAPNQLWTVSNPPNAAAGGSTVNSKVTDTYLGVVGGSPQSGARTTVGPSITGAFYQRFNLVAAPTAWGYASEANPGCLDATSPDTVVQGSCGETTKLGRQWRQGSFPSEGSVSYIYLVNLLTGNCLTIIEPYTNPITTKTSPCIQGNGNQQWQINLILSL